LVILRGIDSTLCGNAVRPPGAVLNAERFYIVAEFTKRRGGRCAGESGADNDNVVLTFVGRIDQLGVAAKLIPLLGERTFGNACV